MPDACETDVVAFADDGAGVGCVVVDLVGVDVVGVDGLVGSESGNGRAIRTHESSNHFRTMITRRFQIC